ncbi:hypothetical protein [Salipiger sp. CCB-MM3]|nr:hypothetical protein [Salipiger sp. CCB-MM3]
MLAMTRGHARQIGDERRAECMTRYWSLQFPPQQRIYSALLNFVS